MAGHTRFLALWAALLLLGPAGCGGDLQKVLDQLAGRPAAQSATGTADQAPVSVPSGPHLYCITNIGHTLVAFSLAERRVLPGTRRYLDLDPVGPWFAGGLGYYLARVDTSGAGANALVEFDPASATERRRLKFAALSNPTALLLPPAFPGIAWVALRGSTFDNFLTNGVAVVDLAAFTASVRDLNALRTAAGTAVGALVGGQKLTSLAGLLWDGACPAAGGAPCVYALVNNFDGQVRNGWLLALGLDATGGPVLLDAVAVGLNPMEDMYLDAARRELWVVNNGGYSPGGQPGTLQVLDTTRIGDGIPGNETVATVALSALGAVGADPTGIWGLGADSAWVTTYPSDALLAVSLPGRSAAPIAPAALTLTGPLIHTASPSPALYAGKGGFGPALLAELDPASGALLATHDLQSGNGPVSCAEYRVP
jgi:hypothetical protein